MVAISSPHFVIFPFMAQGHTIPLLYLARLLWQRHVPVTVFTTTANSPSVHATLHDAASISIIELPFPANIDGIPQGVENTDKLPSILLFPEFASATKLMQPEFEKALEELKPVGCIISDAFLGWTRDSAAKLGIPRIGFYGMSSFATTMCVILDKERPHALTTSLDEPFSIPNFPKLSLTRNEFDPPFNELEPKGPWVDFMIEQNIAMAKSYGMIVNTFYELEPAYTDYWNRCIGPKAWCLGPLAAAKPPVIDEESAKPTWRLWLDEKLKNGEQVLYVAFGTQAEVSQDQLLEIAIGLEQSKVNFLWVIRSKTLEILEGFEERVKDRGIIVKEWVDQMEILRHNSVKWFLSHCGWNSVTESITAGVPILAMPFMAEQHLNARFVSEEIGVGLRIMPSNGSMRGFVKWEEVEERVKELKEGRKGEEIRKKMKKVGEAARGAIKEGGSSWQTLDQLIHDISNYQTISSF